MYRKNTGKITHIIIGILNQSSLFTLNLNSTLPAYRTNFAEVAGTTQKVALDRYPRFDAIQSNSLLLE
jgi:hypothetical protein